MAKTVCAEPGCPVLTDTTRCPAHARAADLSRGTRYERGYGSDHRSLRKQWAPKVAAGLVSCWRCGIPITSGEPWDLGHDDVDRTVTRGPEHANQCNRSAAGRSRHGLAPR